MNIGNGNLVVAKTIVSLPGRGLNTIASLTYNSQEAGSVSPVGNNWSLAISGLTPLGLPLDIHPNASETAAGRTAQWVGFTDGDGTYHRFDGRASGGTTVYDAPPGVHLYLRKSGTDWLITKPNRTTYRFDASGYANKVSDGGGNELTFNYTTGLDQYGEKQLSSVVDAGGRRFCATGHVVILSSTATRPGDAVLKLCHPGGIKVNRVVSRASASGTRDAGTAARTGPRPGP